MDTTSEHLLEQPDIPAKLSQNPIWFLNHEGFDRPPDEFLYLKTSEWFDERSTQLERLLVVLQQILHFINH